MPHYLRAHVPGGSYFFTVALLERRRRLLTAHIDALRAAFRSVHTQRPFHIDAIVVLPDHLHCIWTLAPDDADFAFLPRHRAGAPVIIAKADETRTGHLGNGDSGSTRSGIKGISMRTSTTFTSMPSNMGGCRASPIGRMRVPSIRALGGATHWNGPGGLP